MRKKTRNCQVQNCIRVIRDHGWSCLAPVRDGWLDVHLVNLGCWRRTKRIPGCAFVLPPLEGFAPACYIIRFPLARVCRPRWRAAEGSNSFVLGAYLRHAVQARPL